MIAKRVNIIRTAKTSFAAGALNLLGRRNLVRLGRFISNEARLDVPNEIERNGERSIQRALLQCAVPGRNAVVFDVGANVGLWTRELLADERHRAFVKVHLFEPAQATFNTLVTNLATWGLDFGAVANRSALSSRDEFATLYSRGENAGTNSLYRVESDAESIATEQVVIERCATYCERSGIKHINLLKIDAEGHDIEIILGASPLLENRRIDAVQFEYNWRWIDARHFLKDAFAIFLPLGYFVGKVTPGGVEFYEDWHFELETFREANFVAVTSEWRARLPHIRWWNAP